MENQHFYTENDDAEFEKEVFFKTNLKYKVFSIFYVTGPNQFNLIYQ